MPRKPPARRPANESTDRIRTVIADSHPVVALGIERCLTTNGFDVSGIVSDTHSLTSLVELARPTLIVMETTVENRSDQLSAAIGFVQRYGSRVLAFTADISPVSVHAALDSGCLGVVPRTASIESLLVGARAVAAGRQHVHPLALTAMLQGNQVAIAGVDRLKLSAREFGVLSLVGEGLTNSVIAERLGIAPSTVKTHVERLLRKLAARDRAHAVRNAMRLGMIE
jgi:two-component system nitrate/nitrite response regulator NarL